MNRALNWIYGLGGATLLALGLAAWWWHGFSWEVAVVLLIGALFCVDGLRGRLIR